jgi:hemerythrin-like domain-containing protein
MTEKTPTDILEEEHRVIEKVIGAMAVIAETLEQKGHVEVDTLRDMAAFMRTYADQCHHGKEETHLFPALEQKGVPSRGCPVGALLQEHKAGRALVAALTEAVNQFAGGDNTKRDAVISSLRGLVALYPGHIWKEDYLLFPMANKVLSRDDQTDLRERFEAVEVSVGHDVHHRFEKMAERLASVLGSRS